LSFDGSGTDEIGVIEKIIGSDAPACSVGDVVVRIDAKYFRPAEVQTLLGDATKAKKRLGWTPQITAREICTEMTKEDLEGAKKHALLLSHGYKAPVKLEN
jgi:GDPmannose 4,6-dehydratase